MKVLFTTPVLEHPAAGGPQLRIENSIKALNMAGELHVMSRVAVNSMGGEKAEGFYRGHCRNFSYTPAASPSLRHTLLRKTGFSADDQEAVIRYADRFHVDVVWYGYGNISFDLIRAVKAKRPRLKAVCDTDSVWSRFVLRELPFESDPTRRAEIEALGRKKEEEEKTCVNLCEVTTAVSEVDAAYYRSIAKEPERVKIFSNVIDLKSYKVKPPKPEGFKNPCFYLAGTFWEKSPMEKAARWVIEKVMPLVKKEIHGVHFYIIGKGSDEVLKDVKDKDITITGRLDSVLPYLCNSDAAIVPLMFESGTRFKILEAGACGVPIVSTTLGAEGIPVTDGKEIILADGPEAFARGIIRLIKDRSSADDLTRNCKALIERGYSVEALSREAEAILNYLKMIK